MPGLRTIAEYIIRCTVKSGVTVAYGQAVVFTGTDDEIDLPAGTGALIYAGQALGGGTGAADGSVKIDVAIAGPSLPGIAAAAIAAGSTVVTNSTTGKVSNATTAGAIIGRAISNAAADGDRVWLKVG